MSWGVQQELISLHLTHVYYNPADPLSFISAHLALVPQALMVIYVTLIYARREIDVLLMFVGQVGSELANYILKHIIREERPQEILGEGYGMPSSHSQFMTFFAVYVTLYLLHRTQKVPLLQRIAQSTIVIFGASLVCLSRIYLRYHTPLQVLYGALIGAILGVAWYIFVVILRALGFVDWLLHVWFVEMLWFKDGDIGSLEHDLCEEWMEWRKSQELERSHQNGSKTKVKAT